MTLDPALEDSSGLPAPTNSLQSSSNSKKMLKQGRERCEEILTRAGAGRCVIYPSFRGQAFI